MSLYVHFILKNIVVQLCKVIGVSYVLSFEMNNVFLSLQ